MPALDDDDDDDDAPADDDEALALIARRLEDLDAGRAKVIDGKAAIAKARAELARRAEPCR